MSNETDVHEKFAQLQMMENNLQSFMAQKNSLQQQLAEITSALSELKDSQESYKIVGNIMISTSPSDLKKDLEERDKMLSDRLSSLEDHENNIRETAEKLQKEIMETVKNDGDQ